MRLLLLSSLLFSALTNADIVRLVKAGLSAGTIEAKIASSADQFDTSPDALVELAQAGVPDVVVRAMIEKDAAASNGATTAGKETGALPAATSRRYDVAVHSASNVRCEGAELRVDGRGVSSTRCRKLDFQLTWASVRNVCYEYGFRGVITFETTNGTLRISTVTPAEAKRIVDHVRVNAPAVPVAACGR
jgi:hypothetical protein